VVKFVQYMIDPLWQNKKDQPKCPVCQGALMKLFEATSIVVDIGITRDYSPVHCCTSCRRLFKEEE